MAFGHWLTNRGKKYLMDGGWTDAASTNIKVGFIASAQPASLDTAAEVADLNTVADLLGSVTEATFTNYARTSLTRTAPTEDDTNDWVNMDASDVVFASAGGAMNNTLHGTFFYDEGGGSDATRDLLSVHWWTTPVATNGGSLTYAITDVYRAS